MTITTKFFKFPFAVDGDLSTVPDTTQPSGALSYEQGYGPDFQLNYPTDPDSLAIGRGQYNKVLNDVTTAIQQYQAIGTPNFISTSDNLGTPYSYSKWSYALYDDGVNGLRIYQSMVASNTALPTDATKWRLVDNNSQAVIYNNVTFEGTVANGNVVYYDSGNSWFAKAIANGTAAQNVQGIADVTNKRIFVLGLVTNLSGLTPGAIYYLSTTSAGAITSSAPSSDAVQLGTALSATTFSLIPQPPVNGLIPAGTIFESSCISVPAGGYLSADGSAVSRSSYPNLLANTTITMTGTTTSTQPQITGLSDTSKLQPGWPLSGTGVPAGAVIASIDSGTQITMSMNATANGSVPILFAPFGVGDGSTTFNVIDKRGRSGMGAGQGSGLTFRTLGQPYGGEINAFSAANNGTHDHGTGAVITVKNGTGANANNGSISGGNSGSSGSGTPFSILSPVVACNYFVKT